MGSVGVHAQTVQIYDETESPGQINVQVDMLSFTNLGSATLIIEFDSDLLSFSDIANTQIPGAWGANYNATEDHVIVTYFATGTSGENIDGWAFDLVFNYSGGFSSDIVFDEDNCEITDYNLNYINATYVDGSVTQTSTVAGEVSMDSLTDQLIGNTITMPVDMDGSGFTSVDAITFKIGYDQTQLTFGGIVEDELTDVDATASNGVLTIEWYSDTPEDLSSAHLFDIEFVYLGGEADVEFKPGSEVSSGLDILAVDYIHGSVEPTDETATLTIEGVAGESGNVVSVPITAENIGQTLGSISLYIAYDNSNLSYGNFTADQLSGWNVSANSGVITILWSDNNGATITDGDLITLNFMYNGGYSEVEFNPGCEIKTNNLVNVPVSYYDGYVSDIKVSGNVTYVSDLVIPNTTVYLKSTDGTVTYGSGIADASGDYEILGVAPGSYILDASTTTDATYSYDVTDAFVVYLGTYGSGLYELASDVNEVDGVDVTDAFIIYLSWNAGNVKVPDWSAPDWIFENPSVTITTGNVTQDFQGICSGDANGDFVP